MYTWKQPGHLMAIYTPCGSVFIPIYFLSNKFINIDLSHKNIKIRHVQQVDNSLKIQYYPRFHNSNSSVTGYKFRCLQGQHKRGEHLDENSWQTEHSAPA